MLKKLFHISEFVELSSRSRISSTALPRSITSKQWQNWPQYPLWSITRRKLAVNWRARGKTMGSSKERRRSYQRKKKKRKKRRKPSAKKNWKNWSSSLKKKKSRNRKKKQRGINWSAKPRKKTRKNISLQKWCRRVLLHPRSPRPPRTKNGGGNGQRREVILPLLAARLRVLLILQLLPQATNLPIPITLKIHYSPPILINLLFRIWINSN